VSENAKCKLQNRKMAGDTTFTPALCRRGRELRDLCCFGERPDGEDFVCVEGLDVGRRDDYYMERFAEGVRYFENQSGIATGGVRDGIDDRRNIAAFEAMLIKVAG
jgi:hypothetical protein